MNHEQDDHWLVRPSTIRLMWWGGSVVLLLTVLAQLLFPMKPHFVVDGWLAFGAIFGFLSCVAMVLVAKVLGWILKRSEDYYQDVNGDDDV